MKKKKELIYNGAVDDQNSGVSQELSRVQTEISTLEIDAQSKIYKLQTQLQESKQKWEEEKEEIQKDKKKSQAEIEKAKSAGKTSLAKIQEDIKAVGRFPGGDVNKALKKARLKGVLLAIPFPVTMVLGLAIICSVLIVKGWTNDCFNFAKWEWFQWMVGISFCVATIVAIVYHIVNARKPGRIYTIRVWWMTSVSIGEIMLLWAGVSSAWDSVLSNVAWGCLWVEFCLLGVWIVCCVHSKANREPVSYPAKLTCFTANAMVTIVLSVVFCVFGSPFVRGSAYDVKQVQLYSVNRTVLDCMGIETSQTYTIEDGITTIDSRAFEGITTYSKVEFAEKTVRCYANAFKDSSVKTLIVKAGQFRFYGEMDNTKIERIIFENDAVVDIQFLDDGLKEDVALCVPKTLIDEYRQRYETFADQFVPDVAEQEIYVMYNVTAPTNLGGIGDYIQTQIVSKDETTGQATFTLPYTDKMVNSNGELRWGYNDETESRKFVLHAFTTVNGENILPNDNGTITLSESAILSVKWVETFDVYADFTHVGGGKSLIMEVYEGMTESAIPSTGEGVSFYPGYVISAWTVNAIGSGNEQEGLIEKITNYTQSQTVYPLWSLNKPHVAVEGYEGIYDGQVHNIVVSATHEASNVSYTYWYKKDGGEFMQTNAISVMNVADSGNYTVRVEARDEAGRTSVAEKKFAVVIQRAESQINTSGVQTNFTYNGQQQKIEGGATLNHSESGLVYENNTFTTVSEGNGKKVCIRVPQTDNYNAAQVYVTVSVQKATYDMSGITFVDQSFVYNGTEQHAVISGSLPVGLDGVQLTVRYVGGAKDVAEGLVSTTAVFSTVSKNYNVPNSMNANTRITAKPVQVTADAKRVTYGEGEIALTYTHTGLIAGDSFVGTLERELGTNVGTYQITQGNLSAGSNYEITFVGATYEIEKKSVVVTWNGLTAEIDATSPQPCAPTASVSTINGDIPLKVIVRLADSSQVENVVEEGTYTVVASFVDSIYAQNYTLTNAEETFVVTTKA